MTNEEIQEIALANGFSLKKQPDGSMALNPYVFEFARALVAAQNEKCNAELKKASDTLRVYHEEIILLKTEIEALKGRLHGYVEAFRREEKRADDAERKIDTLEAEVEGLRKDAERLVKAAKEAHRELCILSGSHNKAAMGLLITLEGK